MHPLKLNIFEIVKDREKITDSDLIKELKKKGIQASERELNKMLLHLEILGLVTVRWVGKDKKRIELRDQTASAPKASW
ncbi:MAG TPA: hypothetical protein VIH27_02745 [Nitrososphaerales archaeon]